MSREQKVAAVEAYLDCFETKDLSKVPLAENVTFEGPLVGTLTGRQTVKGFLAIILLMVKGVRVKQHIVEGNYVATVTGCAVLSPSPFPREWRSYRSVTGTIFRGRSGFWLERVKDLPQVQHHPRDERNQQQRPSGDRRYHPHRPIRSLRRRLLQNRIVSHQQ